MKYQWPVVTTSVRWETRTVTCSNCGAEREEAPCTCSYCGTHYTRYPELWPDCQSNTVRPGFATVYEASYTASDAV